MSTAIVWFRQDLRLADNPALVHAVENHDRLLLVYIDDPQPATAGQIGSASRAWLHHSLVSLQESLARVNQQLVFFTGDSKAILETLVAETAAELVVWNRCYEPETVVRDTRIKTALARLTEVKSFNASLLVEPWDGCKDDGSPYRVFTPYWRRIATRLDSILKETPSLPAPASLPKPVKTPPQNSCSLDELELLPALDWHRRMLDHWEIGEEVALSRCTGFVRTAVHAYDEARNLPGVEGTSRLSPHLHFGEISPRQILSELCSKCPEVYENKSSAETFAKEIVWREFAYHLLHHFPYSVNQPLDKRFDAFPWPRLSRKKLERWQLGQTGIPIVDAGMRELWQTGWMHNRVRMIVASFLIKNLLIRWQQGETWFRDTLVDADIASNVMGWQWTAGCGADAAPYFRVFNPVLQGEKFDRNGDYVRCWVPELKDVELKFIHKPWELPGDESRALDYPEPMVDLKASRQAALAAFEQIKTASV